MLTSAERRAIDDLYASFVDIVARRSPRDLAALFGADAVVEGPLAPPSSGVDAIVASMAAGFATWEILLLVPQALIVLTHGPRVRTRWYVAEVGRREGDDVFYAGVYHDELACEDGRWRFQRRRFDLLYARTGAGSVVPPFPHALDDP